MRPTAVLVLSFVSLVASGCAGRGPGWAGPDGANHSRYGPGDSAAMSAFAELAATLDSGAAAASLRAACRGQRDIAVCYDSYLVPLASSGRIRAAMASLSALAAADPAVRRSGHVHAHAIGIAAGQRAADVAAAFTECSVAFQSGCYHGVIQAWFARLGSVSAEQANALCEPFRGDESKRWILFQCVHGMGHGFTALEHHDLVKGLAGCDLLTGGWDRHSCYGGAFMENIVNVTVPHHPASALSQHHHTGAASFKAVDPADPHYPCSILESRYLRACYDMQTSVMLYNNRGDVASAARACEAAPPLLRTVCHTSLGRDISSISMQEHAEGIRLCSLASELYRPWCYVGLVKNIIDIDARVDAGLALCSRVPEPLSKLLCYSAVGEQISVLTAGETSRRQMCAPADASYLAACLYGARIPNQPPPPELVDVWKGMSG